MACANVLDMFGLSSGEPEGRQISCTTFALDKEAELGFRLMLSLSESDPNECGDDPWAPALKYAVIPEYGCEACPLPELLGTAGERSRYVFRDRSEVR